MRQRLNWMMAIRGAIWGLYVPARTSTFYFKGKQTTISDIAKALGVAHVLDAVVEQLKITLLGAAPRAKAADPKAHDLFLQGRQLSRQKTSEGFTHAIALYEQALTIDRHGYRA
jgi:hypothetical protein